MRPAGDVELVLELALQHIQANELVTTCRLVSKGVQHRARNEMQRRGMKKAVVHVCRTQAGAGGVPLHAVTHRYNALGRRRQTLVAQAAAAQGQVDVLQWLHTQGVKFSHRTCAVAAGGGHVAVLRWLRQQGYRLVASMAVAAARRGHTDVLTWMDSQGYRLSPDLASTAGSAAAGSGHMAVLNWLHQRQTLDCTRLYNSAASNGRVDVLDWLHDHGYTHPTLHVSQMTWEAAAAASFGHVLALEWLHVHGWGHNPAEVVLSAAGNGHVAVLEWVWRVHHIGCPRSVCAYIEAASAGHVTVLSWLYAHGWPFDEEPGDIGMVGIRTAHYAAAENGHIGALNWLHDHGCMWDNMTCVHAARGGQLTVLQWLLERAGPLDRSAVEAEWRCPKRSRELQAVLNGY
jgi:hypothetical protein